MDTVKIGDFLAAMRKSNGYTQQQIADRLNISNKTVSKWESGVGIPEISLLPAIAELYGVTVDEILSARRYPKETGEKAAHSEETKKYLLANAAATQKIFFAGALALEAFLYLCMLLNGVYFWLCLLLIIAGLFVFTLGGILLKKNFTDGAIFTETDKKAFSRETKNLSAIIYIMTCVNIKLTLLMYKCPSITLYFVIEVIFVLAAAALYFFLFEKPSDKKSRRIAALFYILLPAELIFVGLTWLTSYPFGSSIRSISFFITRFLEAASLILVYIKGVGKNLFR